MTRKVTFGLANSVDNKIARSNHAVDWLVWDDEVAGISAAFFETIDTVLMGRKTYEVAVQSGNLERLELKPLRNGSVFVLYRVKK